MNFLRLLVSVTFSIHIAVTLFSAIWKFCPILEVYKSKIWPNFDFYSGLCFMYIKGCICSSTLSQSCSFVKNFINIRTKPCLYCPYLLNDPDIFMYVGSIVSSYLCLDSQHWIPKEFCFGASIGINNQHTLILHKPLQHPWQVPHSENLASSLFSWCKWSFMIHEVKLDSKQNAAYVVKWGTAVVTTADINCWYCTLCSCLVFSVK